MMRPEIYENVDALKKLAALNPTPDGAAAVGGVLLALIEGMGIMFGKMFAPPSPDQMLAEQQQFDPTAPPTQGGLFPTSMGAATAPPPPTTSGSPPPSSQNTPNDPFDTPTTFSTNDSSTSFSNTQEEPSGGSSWWPFGGN